MRKHIGSVDLNVRTNKRKKNLQIIVRTNVRDLKRLTPKLTRQMDRFGKRVARVWNERRPKSVQHPSAEQMASVFVFRYVLVNPKTGAFQVRVEPKSRAKAPYAIEFGGTAMKVPMRSRHLRLVLKKGEKVMYPHLIAPWSVWKDPKELLVRKARPTTQAHPFIIPAWNDLVNKLPQEVKKDIRNTIIKARVEVFR